MGHIAMVKNIAKRWTRFGGARHADRALSKQGGRTGGCGIESVQTKPQRRLSMMNYLTRISMLQLQRLSRPDQLLPHD